ncbi:Fe(3+) ABC transporter substrate-binding protein [Pelistega ratti]|uniref:Fe(3+) ABC transporter substrate-binding protein n=1 Tax=Pelistega ratti TaxID=2652177 RepID=UPI001357D5F6
MKFSTFLKPIVLACTLASSMVHATEEVNIYTTREPGLLQPLLDQFTKDTGVKVNTVFVKDGLAERVTNEGNRSPADILMVVDIGRLTELSEKGLAQPIKSAVLEDVIPPQYRDPNGEWFALSLRDRILYVAKDLDLDHFTYEELADPKWKGKVCIRSGQHPYNTSLISAFIAHNGEAKTEEWLKGIKANLARKAAGGDREVARDILAGICDIGIANSYYVGRMRNEKEGSEQRQWGDAIKVIRPVFASAKDGGTHANVSGAVVAKYAPHKENAVKLLEYLVSDKAQAMYAKINYEYPVRKGTELDPIVASFGEFKADALPMSEVPKNRQKASELVDKVGFDN